PRPVAGERLGLGLRGPVPDRRNLRQLPAPQAGPAGPAADPHPARGGVQPAGAGAGRGGARGRAGTAGRPARAQASGMNGPGRLSLRARLLVVLIAVTAAFLLVMGGVTAFVLSKRLGTQFDDGLISAAARTPVQIQSNPGDYVAVEVTRFPLAVHPLTGSTGTTSELASALEKIVTSGNFHGYAKDIPFTVPGTAPRLRAVARPVRAAGVRPAGARPAGGRRFLAVLVVARPVGVVTGQVGGIVVAEL